MSAPRPRRPFGTSHRAFAALLLAIAIAGCANTVSWNPAGVEYDSQVFDHAPSAGPAIADGIAIAEGEEGGQRHHVALVASADEAERFDRELLEAEGALDFVDETDFDHSYLVVFQASPASSRPDYRVEGIEMTDGVLEFRVDDSSGGGTTDVTVETLLVRVDRDGHGIPDEVVVTTEEEEGVSTRPTASADGGPTALAG